MGNNLDKLMQKSVISENIYLSKMIEDIVPNIEQKYTNVELEANKKEEFSLVVYQKQNIFTRFLKIISISIEKLRIMKNIREFELKKITTKN